MLETNQQVISLDERRTPKLSETSWLAPGSFVIGDVTLGEHTSIWYNAVLRADSAPITIGENSNVQDGVAIHVDAKHPTVIGDRVSIGHNAVVHGARIGNDTLIGMNATILSGAVIGERCLIAAGALIAQGKTMPNGVLIAGIPAKIVRELTEEEQANLTQNSETYLRNTSDHERAVVNMGLRNVLQ